MNTKNNKVDIVFSSTMTVKQTIELNENAAEFGINSENIIEKLKNYEVLTSIYQENGLIHSDTGVNIGKIVFFDTDDIENFDFEMK